MSKYTVKFLKSQIEGYADSVKEGKERIQKAILQIGLLQRQTKQAPKEFKYIYKEAIYELKKDEIMNAKASNKEDLETINKFKKALPDAIKYEQRNPDRAADTMGDRKRKNHLDKIRSKAIGMSKARALAKRIQKATGLHATALESLDTGLPMVVVHNHVKSLNEAKKKVPELASAKVEDVYKDGISGMRGCLRVVIK